MKRRDFLTGAAVAALAPLLHRKEAVAAETKHMRCCGLTYASPADAMRSPRETLLYTGHRDGVGINRSLAAGFRPAQICRPAFRAIFTRVKNCDAAVYAFLNKKFVLLGTFPELPAPRLYYRQWFCVFVHDRSLTLAPRIPLPSRPGG